MVLSSVLHMHRVWNCGINFFRQILLFGSPFGQYFRIWPVMLYPTVVWCLLLGEAFGLRRGGIVFESFLSLLIHIFFCALVSRILVAWMMVLPGYQEYEQIVWECVGLGSRVFDE